jgi:hypothetical protein
MWEICLLGHILSVGGDALTPTKVLRGEGCLTSLWSKTKKTRNAMTLIRWHRIGTNFVILSVKRNMSAVLHLGKHNFRLWDQWDFKKIVAYLSFPTLFWTWELLMWDLLQNRPICFVVVHCLKWPYVYELGIK